MAKLAQRAIMENFHAMLEEMPLEKITVSALAKRCDISPNTFYYHYGDLYELLNVWLLETPLQWQQADTAPDDWRTILRDFLEGCRKNQRIIYHIYNSISRDQLEQYVFTSTDDVFYDQVSRLCGDWQVSEEKRREISEFCRYAVIGFFLKFLWNRMEGDIPAMVDRLGDLLERFVIQAVRDNPTAAEEAGQRSPNTEQLKSE